jgi:cold shock CspA family protein
VDIGKRPDKITRETAPSPTQPIGTVGTARGVVKWWRNEKGYAISCVELDPWDIWCHFGHIEGTGFRTLTVSLSTSRSTSRK